VWYIFHGWLFESEAKIPVTGRKPANLTRITGVKNMKTTIARNSAVKHGIPWAERSDEELIAEYQRHETRRAFEELVHRYERELHSYLRRYLGDAVLADDAFQATFLQVHLKRDQFDADRKFRPWLYTIATNQAIDAQRRNKRHRMISLDRAADSQQGEEIGTLLQLLASSDVEASTDLITAEHRDWIRTAVDELPELLRSALILVYYQGMKYREAADVLDIPVGTVKSRLHAAILKLHEAWHRSHPAEHD
jgi:RNA polymerase sigma-70 factor, ECF subfamily